MEEKREWYSLVELDSCRDNRKLTGADAYVTESSLKDDCKWEEVNKDSLEEAVLKTFGVPIDYFKNKERFESDGLVVAGHGENDIAGRMVVCKDGHYYLLGKYYDYFKKWDSNDVFIGYKIDYDLVMAVRYDVFEELFWKETTR